MSHLLKGKHKAHASADSSNTTTGIGSGSGSGLAHKHNPSTTSTLPLPPATITPTAPSLRSSSSKTSTRAPTATTTGMMATGTGIGASADRTDALWAEMQATLEAVELSAGTAGSGNSTGSARVFSPDHERKLEGLRAAQIALAQAWARSEADEAIETGTTAAAAAASGGGGGAGEGGEGKSVTADGAAAAAAGGKSTVGSGSVRPTSSGFGIGSVAGGDGQHPRSAAGGKMEEETEADILLARKRREANDRYFQRVSQGVLDVVAKLEEVAISMREVEQASKELWGEDHESESGRNGGAKA
ncbi:hypothetical protein VTJ49DRAFT_4439 [Mycothermus thermophilus]|uniref:Uncharacterized protein n=1 Tax=Humicola insolens TaxID=85995 RepID=A0ABR3V5F7_HUMIN